MFLAGRYLDKHEKKKKIRSWEKEHGVPRVGMAKECSIILGGPARLHRKNDKELKWHEGGNSVEGI